MQIINHQNLSNIQFRYAVTETAEFSFHRAPTPGWYELIYLIKGQLRFILRETTSFFLPADSLFLLPPKLPCNAISSDPEPVEFLHVRFYAGLLAAERRKPLLKLFNENISSKENYYTDISDSEMIHSLRYFFKNRAADELTLQMGYALAIENILMFIYQYDLETGSVPPPENIHKMYSLL